MTPHRATQLVRLCLGLGAVLLTVLMLGPFQALENAIPVSDKILHAGAFYLLANMLFIALPKNRRLDIALGLMAIGGASEVMQGMVGRDMSLGDFLADAAGVYMAVAPMWVERLRKLTRETPHGNLALLWRSGDRRRGGVRVVKPRPMKPWSHAAAPVRQGVRASSPRFNPDGRTA